MASDGSIKINIEVDGKRINIAAKELDKLEESGQKSGKGIKAAESSMDDLSNKSAKAGSSVKGASDAIDNLGDSGSKAGKGLKGAEGSVDSLSDKSASASSNVKGASDSLDGLADSGSKAGKNLQGADGAIDGIADSSAQAASGVKGVSDSLDGMAGKADEAAKGAKKVKDETDGVGQTTSKASISIKDLAVSFGLVAIGTAAFNTLSSSLDTAIARFDTLNSFPKVLQALGVSAEDSEAAMSKLSDGIDGLPTTLNDIAASAQRMYTSFDDMDVAADTAIALNNAMLGSGSSAEQAQRGVDQYTKALQTGKIQMDTWNTLSETMDVGLIKIAEGFGYAGKSAKDDLYNALQDGTVTMDQFNDKLIEVGTGTGIMAELARENSLGIATSLGNLRNSAARGVADIIASFDKLAQEVTGKDIAQNIDALKVVVNSSFKLMGSVIEGTVPVITLFAGAVTTTLPVVQALTPAIIGLVAAYATYTVISKTTDVIKASNAVLMAAQVSQNAMTLAVTANTVAQAKQTGTITVGNLVIGVLTGRITLATAATIAKTTATYAWGTALKFLEGPVGWIVTGIGLLVVGTIALVKWFNKTTEESNRLNAETEKLGESVNSLTDSVDSNAESYKQQQVEIEATAKSNSDLAAKIEELSDRENKSAAEKQMLASYVDQLNESVEGLNLSYNAEADALSMSSEELQGRIDLMEQQTSYNEALERQVEIAKEQHEVDSKLGEINELRQEWLEKMENGEIKSKEYAAALAELDEQELSLKETNADLAVQFQETESQMTESMNAITEAVKNGVSGQILAYESLTDSQKAAFDSIAERYEMLKETATNAFDKIETESKLSMDAMQKNLEHNQQAVQEWGENQSELMGWAAENGHVNFMKWIEQLGPDHAGELKMLAENLRESGGEQGSELDKLAETYSEGYSVAAEAGKKSLGEGFEEIHDVVVNSIEDTATTMREQIKSADFESIGIDITDGLSGGIDSGSKDVSDSAKKVADESVEATKNALQSSSPSKVYEAIGGDITDGLVLGIDGGAGKVVQAIQKMFQSVQTDSKQSFDAIVKDHDIAVKEIETTLNKLPEITQKAMKDMLDRLKSGTAPQVQVMKTLAKDLLSPFDNTPSQFETIGTDAMAGFNRGLDAGKAQVLATVTSIADQAAQAMRKALDIHSPSRVTTKIGEQTGEGFTKGIKGQGKKASKAAEKLAKEAAKKLKDTLDHSKQFIDDKKYFNQLSLKEELKAWERVQAKYKKGTKERIEAEKNVYRVKKEIEKQGYEDSKAFLDKKKYYNQMSLNEELSAWERIQARYKVGTKEREEADRQVYRLKNELIKDEFDFSKNWIAKKKQLNKLSLTDELAAWERVQARYTEGSKERIEAEQNIYRVKKEISDNLTSLNDDHFKKVEDTLQKEKDSVQKLRDEYKKMEDDRTQSLYSFAGIFDELKEKTDVSGQQLIENLKGQVNTFAEWSSNIKKLAERGIDEGLLGELRDMGPKAAAEIAALNSLSDSQLEEYASLWKIKSSQAREQAQSELESNKLETEQKIEEIHKQTEKQLDKLQKEWQSNVEEIRRGTKDEFDVMKSDLNTIGKQSIEGMIDGLNSMEGALLSRARAIANAVKSTMQSALDINSPSGVMRDDVGRWIPAGIALGIKDNAKAVYKELDSLSEGMILASSPEVALGVPGMAYNGWGSIANNSTTSNDNRKTFSPKIENHFTPAESTPSESARKQEQLLQRLAMEF